jgi:glutamate dehydrogenase
MWLSIAIPPPSTRTDGLTDIRTVSDTAFLEKARPHTLAVYQKILRQVESRYGPVLEVFEVEGTRERRLVIGYRMGGTSRFFRCALSNLCLSDSELYDKIRPTVLN